jgi:two-component system OmpR family response regulator
VTLRAFVVEDNASIRESLVEALEELAGIATAGVAGTEQAAVEWLADASHAWDIAIVDLALEPGGGTGFGVLRALRTRDPRRKVVVLTGAGIKDVGRECEALGCDRVFDKAMETDALLDYCQALAQGADGSVRRGAV